jgi:hypothetical protein
MSIDDVHDESNVICPYCSCSGECSHVLLVVDKTFRTAEGGVLMKSFNARWSKLCEEGGDDFDERESFENLLEEVDSFADSSADLDHEGGPGMSSAYAIYYGESAEMADAAVARFVMGGEV